MSKELKIGITGIFALVTLFLGIKFLKGVSLFSAQNVYFIQFTNAKGLSKSSTVYADGYKVGIVSDILYDYKRPGFVLVKISTDKQLRIPKGSNVRLDEAILGGCTLNMRLAGDIANAYVNGDTIQGDNSSGVMAKAANMMPQVEQVIARVDTLVATLNTLAGNPNLPLIMQNANQMVANLNESSERLKVLMDNDVPKLVNTFGQAGDNVVQLTANLNDLKLQKTMDSVNCVIGNVNQMVTQMQSTEGTLGLLMKDQSLYANLNHTVQSADSLVTDLKAHPKRYVHFSVFGKKEK
ncbi:MAG: MCE family protein [Bacteroidaceae bacterium]|nr:MCE family protein [Bacteroidaceae bacterium]